MLVHSLKSILARRFPFGTGAYVLIFVFCLSLFWAVAVQHQARADLPAERAILSYRPLLLDAALAETRVVAVGERGHVLLSDDAGDTWRQAHAPTQATLTAVYFHDAKNGWAVGHDAVILHTQDGGQTWRQQHAAPQKETPLLDVWFRDQRHGFAVGAYGAFYATSDGGEHWQERRIIEEDKHFNAILGTSEGIFIVGEAGGVYVSQDQGRTWRSLATPYAGSYFGLLALPDRSLLLFGLRGKVFRSENGGRSWSPVKSDAGTTLIGGTVLPDKRVILVGTYGLVLRSDDGGRRFRAENLAGRPSLTAVVRAADGKLLAFGETGVKVLAP